MADWIVYLEVCARLLVLSLIPAAGILASLSLKFLNYEVRKTASSEKEKLTLLPEGITTACSKN